jgi:hypothetical protein
VTVRDAGQRSSTVRRFVIHCATISVLVASVPNLDWAGSTGRRNTAIAATAVAAGAWANGTGRAGRRNTALVATAGAAYAWKRYGDKRKEEKRSKRRVVVYQSRPAGRRVGYVHAASSHGRKVVHWRRR